MKEITDLLNSVKGSESERLKARRQFLKRRSMIWEKIQDRRLPKTYVSHSNRKFVGAPAGTAIRCDFLLANKIALGPKYRRDKVADLAQRDLLFSVLRGREVFPHRSGKKFYCCPKCTGKLYECVSAKVFRYIDNDKWKSAIESEA
jgi:hypothetical protein